MARIKSLTEKQRDLLKTKVRNSDFEFFVGRPSLTEARGILLKRLGFEFSNREFKKAREEICKWYRVKSRKPKSTQRLLSDEGWENLRNVILQLKDELKGRTLSEATEIVLTVHSCNYTQLQGLAKRYRVWEISS